MLTGTPRTRPALRKSVPPRRVACHVDSAGAAVTFARVDHLIPLLAPLVVGVLASERASGALMAALAAVADFLILVGEYLGAVATRYARLLSGPAAR